MTFEGEVDANFQGFYADSEWLLVPVATLDMLLLLDPKFLVYLGVSPL